VAAYYEPPYATPLQRGIAYVLDSFGVTLAWAVYDVAVFGSEANDFDLTRLFGFLLFAFVYYVSFMVMFCATPGKLALRMRIATEDGERPEPANLLLRFAAFFMTILVPFGALISGYYMVRQPDRQAIHDRIAHTVVIRAR
jgi:uncharacterized RDD family membrane protein YckC